MQQWSYSILGVICCLIPLWCHHRYPWKSKVLSTLVATSFGLILCFIRQTWSLPCFGLILLAWEFILQKLWPKECNWGSWLFSWCTMLMTVSLSQCLSSEAIAEESIPISYIVSLLISGAIGFGIHKMTKSHIATSIYADEDHKISVIYLLGAFAAVIFVVLWFVVAQPVTCLCICVILAILLTVSYLLWRDVSLVVAHNVEHRQERRRQMDHLQKATESTETTMQRQLVEANLRFDEVRLAYQRQDHTKLEELLAQKEDYSRVSFCSFTLLDAVLKRNVVSLQDIGWTADIQVQLGSVKGYSLLDIGVLLDQMIGVMSYRKMPSRGVLRIRMQEWGNHIIMVVGHREAMNGITLNQENLLNQLTEDYSGRWGLVDKDQSHRLWVVLPSKEKK